MVSVKLKGFDSSVRSPILAAQVLREPRAVFGKAVVALLEITRLQLDQVIQVCTCDLGTNIFSSAWCQVSKCVCSIQTN